MGARADEGQEKQSALQERCAQRLAIALTGKSALNEPSSRDGAPKGNDAQGAQGTLPTLLTSGDFQERFARFINSEFNPGPATIDLADAPYFLAKHVLTKGLPWSEMFLGQYRFAPVASNVAVFGDSDGLGYFRSRDWYQRYEGNEESGLKIATAYRIMNNVVGLQLTAVTASPNVDQSATGRKASPCNACHFNGWYALDSVASVLPKKGERFDAYRGGQ
jgi:hypothetical protein